MKRFLKKRWHSIPIGIITALLILGLVAGGVFATYNWLSFTAEFEVEEPLSIQYNVHGLYGGPGEEPGDPEGVWIPLSNNDILPFRGDAGNDYDIHLRIHSASRADLPVKLLVSGNTGKITCTGGLQRGDDDIISGVTVPADKEDGTFEWDGYVNIKINNDTPSGDYSLTFTFTRG